MVPFSGNGTAYDFILLLAQIQLVNIIKFLKIHIMIIYISVMLISL